MESASLPRIPLLASSQNAGLHRRSPQSLPLSQTLRSRSVFAKTRCFGAPISGDRGPPIAAPASRVLACISSSAASSGSGGGGDGLGAGGGGGGDDGGSSGRGTEAEPLARGSDEVPPLGSDVIILSVGGMSCGGCAASVKRILESQPQVSSATVNLETETAVVWVVPEAKVTKNWQQQIGEMLANHLTTCGFKSNLQGQGHAIEGEIQS